MGTPKTGHRRERVLRQILMLLRLQRIKARMAAITSSNRASSVQHRRLPRPQPHPQTLANMVPVLPNMNHQRMPTSCTSTRYLQFPGIPLPFLNALLQRSNRSSEVIPLLRAVSNSRDSKRSLRFSQRSRQSLQMQRLLERQAGSEQPNRPPQVRFVNVIVIQNPYAPSTDGRSSRSSSSTSRSGHSRRRRTHNRSSSSSSSRMGVMPGMPHVLNLLRRMMVPMIENRHGGNQNPNNGRRMFMQEQQARAERTPEKGNSKRGGDVDDKKM